MKNLLIFLVVLFFSIAANSQEIPAHLYSKPNTPIVTVGGFINFNAAYTDQEAIYSEPRLPDAELINNVVDQANPGTYNNHSRDLVFSNDSEVYIKVGAISNSGLKYGAVIELEADVTTSALNEGVNADKSYIFTESKSGKFEFGNNSGVNQRMKVGPASFARAAGGIAGEYVQYINFPMLADDSFVDDDGNGLPEIVCDPVNPGSCDNLKVPRFIVIPQAPIAHGGYAASFLSITDPEFADATNNLANTNGSFARNSLGNNFYDYNDGSFGQMEDATKISFYTPRINNWQFGISYTPDTGDNGTTSTLSGIDTGDIENVIAAGVNYSNNFGNFGLAFSLTGETGSFEQSEYRKFNGNANADIARNDLEAFEGGLMLTYFGFTVGAAYGDWGDSLQAKDGPQSCNYDPTVNFANQDCANANAPSFGDSSYTSLGLAYEFGPIAFSITHLSSEFQNNNYQATSYGLDYKIAKGLLSYVELTQYQFESNQPRALDRADQAVLPNGQRQVNDNEGFVGLAGILFTF
tara:strand:- start:4068 stop:5636 length:1569 start_codon:yes stop_codon:yes gene_type:complete